MSRLLREWWKNSEDTCAPCWCYMSLGICYMSLDTWKSKYMRKAANREYLQLVWFWFIHNIFASATELCPVDETLMMRFSLCALWETDALMAVSMCNVSPLQTKPTSPDMKSQWGRKNLHHTWATPMSLKSYKNVQCLFQGSELSHNLFTEHHIAPWLLVACAL